MGRRQLPLTGTLPLWPLVEAYAEHLRGKGFKEKSVRGVRSALHHFCGFICSWSRHQITEITVKELEAYQIHLLKLKPSTQNNYLVNVRSFFRWLEGAGQLFENPAARLVIPRLRSRIIQVPDEGMVARLLATPDTNTACGIRDRAWLELAYSSGARRIEMVRLSVQDIDLQQRVVRLYGKGDKTRMAPFGKQAAHWLQRYLTEVRPQLLGANQNAGLWLSSRGGQPLGYHAIQQQLRTYTRRSKLPLYLLTAHSLRRACATHMLQHGASPIMLQKLLGHQRSATLSHYLRQTIEDIKATHRASAPGR